MSACHPCRGQSLQPGDALNLDLRVRLPWTTDTFLIHFVTFRCTVSHFDTYILIDLMHFVTFCHILLDFDTFWYILSHFVTLWLHFVTFWSIFIQFVTFCLIHFVTFCHILIHFVTICHILIHFVTFCHIFSYFDRRKFRSQTSDNMDRWEAEQGRGREKRKIRREKSRRERVRRKKMEMREKVGKSRFTVFFH